MTRDEFIQSLTRFIALDLVKGYKPRSPTEALVEIVTDLVQEGRTQLVEVKLDDERGKVLAFSIVGDAPTDATTLTRLLQENQDGHYSRLAIFNGTLVQLFKYPLEELEPVEMARAFNEVAQFGDFYEHKYFNGRDQL